MVPTLFPAMIGRAIAFCATGFRETGRNASVSPVSCLRHIVHSMDPVCHPFGRAVIHGRPRCGSFRRVHGSHYRPRMRRALRPKSSKRCCWMPYWFRTKETNGHLVSENSDGTRVRRHFECRNVVPIRRLADQPAHVLRQSALSPGAIS